MRHERDKAISPPGGGPDAHTAQGIDSAREDTGKGKAGQSVAEAGREAEARAERERQSEPAESRLGPLLHPGAASGERAQAKQSGAGDQQPIGWTGAPERDELAETEQGTPPPGSVFHEILDGGTGIEPE